MAAYTGGVVRYSKATSVSMPSVPIIDGQILFITDTAELYIDDGSTRKKVTSSTTSSSTYPTHLVLARPSDGAHLLVFSANLYASSSSSNIIIDTMSGENRHIVKGYHLYSQYWNECPATGFTDDYANTVDIDLKGIVSAYSVLYYTWFDSVGNEVCFNTIVYPSTYGPAHMEIASGVSSSMLSSSHSSYSPSSSAPSSSEPSSSAPSSSAPLPTQKVANVTVPQNASEIQIYGFSDINNAGLFSNMKEMADTTKGNYECLNISPSVDISSLAGTTIAISADGTDPIKGFCVTFLDNKGVASDTQVIFFEDIKETSDPNQQGSTRFKVSLYADGNELGDYFLNFNVPYNRINSVSLYLKSAAGKAATDYKVIDTVSGITFIDTLNNVYNAEAIGVILVPNGISTLNITGNSIPAPVASNCIVLTNLGTPQSPVASTTPNLYERGVLSKPMSLYTDSDIGQVINIPMRDGTTIPFTIVARNWYKCTDTSIGNTLVLLANNAVRYSTYDTGTISCQKANGCYVGEGGYYQGGRAFWPVSDLRNWLNVAWVNGIDSEILSNNIAEVEIPNSVPTALYDGNNTAWKSNDKAFILSATELNLQAGNTSPSGQGFLNTSGTKMPYFQDNDTACLRRARADIYWTRSWVFYQQISGNITGVGADSFSSVTVVMKNSKLTSPFPDMAVNNILDTDGGNQYKWCSGEHLPGGSSEYYKCPTSGEFGTAVAKDIKAVVPAIVLYDKYS